jgi:hypothetical protein
MRESLNLRDWDKAQQTIREWEAEGICAGVKDSEQPITIERACGDFLADAQARELRGSTLKKYRVLLGQLTAFCKARGLLLMKQLDLTELRYFRQSWPDGGISALKKLERLRAFIRFTQDSGWVSENPAKKLQNPRVTEPPTMPFTREEMVGILAACDQYPDIYGKVGQVNVRQGGPSECRPPPLLCFISPLLWDAYRRRCNVRRGPPHG